MALVGAFGVGVLAGTLYDSWRGKRSNVVLGPIFRPQPSSEAASQEATVPSWRELSVLVRDNPREAASRVSRALGLPVTQFLAAVRTELDVIAPGLANVAAATSLGGLAFFTMERSTQLCSYALGIGSHMTGTGFFMGCGGLLASGATAGYLVREGKYSPEPAIAMVQATMDGVGASMVYYLMGGSWRTLLPNSLLFAGCFAPRSFRYPRKGRHVSPSHTSGHRSVAPAIQSLGSVWGCHSCGTYTGPFVADHCPPTALVERARDRLWTRYMIGVPSQQLLPQCSRCSARQGEVVKDMMSQPNMPLMQWVQSPPRRALMTHYFSVRRHDLAGFAWAVAAYTHHHATRNLPTQGDMDTLQSRRPTRSGEGDRDMLLMDRLAERLKVVPFVPQSWGLQQ
ncbi:unnamed protein product [Vitrella brassicaformis CCMP3155]|uniref:Uncharacterized protein n=2 Tax=Vitrella brassicaformis TaxID=1169539 RepID=A0A0G4E9B0_VITBC|nr:unnamed protein product [Vitrella brassicaformis CCMP3155]|mmetsp:Transcript_38430/g.96272  ORF Transcript_38430/g.96272 Transcript_38430/m.96272 type:complete len:397 (+) Transcript_38430:69-1259(+)|eukprot:CEL92176.1 unnamed protein product [Vitrella brassicaformis CCMP3155]